MRSNFLSGLLALFKTTVGIVFTLFIAVFITACAGPAPTSSPRQEMMVKKYEVPADKALVFIYKVTSLPIGDVDRIHINGKYIADIDQSVFIALLLDPGNYQLTRRSGSLTRYAAEFSFDARGGEKIYLARDFGSSQVHFFRVEDSIQGETRISERRLSRFDDRSFASNSSPAPKALQKAEALANFPTKPVGLHYPTAHSRPDDVAVIIGNANYSLQGKDIPDVTPAYADAAGIKAYVSQALGVREGNIIDIRDATNATMLKVFGSENDHRGQLFDWVLAGVSRVFVYYAGHGAPAGIDGMAYLVPSDADAARIQLNGYPLSRLYRNLGKLPAKSITVVLEACFSGASQGGTVLSKASPIQLRPKVPQVPPNITLIAAGESNQLASWEEDESHSLFTTYFLKGMSGEADSKPFGNGDGAVGYDELDRYFKRTLTYYARRYYGRDQNAQIVVGTDK